MKIIVWYRASPECFSYLLMLKFPAKLNRQVLPTTGVTSSYFLQFKKYYSKLKMETPPQVVYFWMSKIRAYMVEQFLCHFWPPRLVQKIWNKNDEVTPPLANFVRTKDLGLFYHQLCKNHQSKNSQKFFQINTKIEVFLLIPKSLQRDDYKYFFLILEVKKAILKKLKKFEVTFEELFNTFSHKWYQNLRFFHRHPYLKWN